MGAFKFIKENERRVYTDNDRRRELLMELSGAPAFYRVEKPTRLAKAKSLGYRAKQGYIIVRARVGKGGSRRPRPNHARKPSKAGVSFNFDVSSKKIAEGRVNRIFSNMDILGSYFLVDNGQYKWYEVILKDKKITS
ncbi:MAG: 50S ribosomal protein L15e [Candidatus Acidifodinimicrobium sp.]